MSGNKGKPQRSPAPRDFPHHLGVSPPPLSWVFQSRAPRVRSSLVTTLCCSGTNSLHMAGCKINAVSTALPTRYAKAISTRYRCQIHIRLMHPLGHHSLRAFNVFLTNKKEVHLWWTSRFKRSCWDIYLHQVTAVAEWLDCVQSFCYGFLLLITPTPRRQTTPLSQKRTCVTHWLVSSSQTAKINKGQKSTLRLTSKSDAEPLEGWG